MEIKKMHGGLAVVNDGKVLASLPLPVAGLMSEKPAMAVAEKLAAVHEAAKQLGVTIEGPFSAMAFLALPVIPELKLTDKGLVDVIKFEIVDLFV
jgi:adenine deaminase